MPALPLSRIKSFEVLYGCAVVILKSAAQIELYAFI